MPGQNVLVCCTAIHILSRIAAGVRPAREVHFEHSGDLTESCSHRVCQVADGRGARIDQGRFEMTSSGIYDFAWRLKPGATYSAFEKEDCSTKLADAQLLSWLDPTHPLNSSTVEVFIDPVSELRLRSHRSAYLCASELAGINSPTCLCQLELNKKGAGLLHGLSCFLGLQSYPSVAEAEVLIARRCPAAGIPDAVAALLLSLMMCCFLAVAEAAWSAREASKTHQEVPVPAQSVIVTSPTKLLYSACSTAVGFAALLISTQTMTLMLLHQFGTHETVIWVMIGAASLLGVGGLYLFYTVLSRVLLVQACLSRQLCVDKVVSSTTFTALLAAGVLAYALAVGICAVVTAKTMAEAIRVIATAAAGIVGPVMNLGKALRSSLESEAAAVQVKMHVAQFQQVVDGAGRSSTSPPSEQPEKRASGLEGWASLTWAAVVKCCRSGGDPRDWTATSCSGSDGWRLSQFRGLFMCGEPIFLL